MGFWGCCVWVRRNLGGVNGWCTWIWEIGEGLLQLLRSPQWAGFADARGYRKEVVLSCVVFVPDSSPTDSSFLLFPWLKDSSFGN